MPEAPAQQGEQATRRPILENHEDRGRMERSMSTSTHGWDGPQSQALGKVSVTLGGRPVKNNFLYHGWRRVGGSPRC